jgi:phosphoglycolate phosphatase-like HAD superfamily hydrolase
MNKTYGAVIFDLDGTLVNTDLYVVANYTRLFRKYRIKKIPSLEEMIYFSGPTLEEVFAKWMPEENPEILKADFMKWASLHMCSLSCLYPEEEAVLKNLKDHGIKFGLVSNKSSKGVEKVLRYFHLASYFSSLYPVDKCLKPKPDPWPLLHCASDLQETPGKVLYLGDDLSDVKAASAAKMDIGLMTFGLKKLPEDLPLAYRFGSYKEIERVLLYGKQN